MEVYNVCDIFYHDNRYYIVKDCKCIEVYNNDFKFIKHYNIEFECNSITYNNKEKTFYFSLKNSKKQLCKSDDFKCFIPVDLNMLTDCNENIKHIFYCNYLDGILITTSKKVLLFNLANNKIKILFVVKEEIREIIDCVRPLGCDEENKIVLIATLCCGKEILVSYRKGSMYFIAKLKNNKLTEMLYKTNYIIDSMFIVKEKLWIIVTKQCHQKLINTGIECKCYYPKDCGCQIVESIASIEESIANILNSESLKIKAAIKKSDDVNDLLCINSSVKEVIYYVTVLEFLLTEKLKTVKKPTQCDCQKNADI